MKRVASIFFIILLVSSGLLAQRRTGLIGSRRDSGFDFFAFLHPSGNQGLMNTRMSGKMYLFASISPFSAFTLGDMDGWYSGTNLMGAIGLRQLFSNNLGYKATFHYGYYQGKDTDPLNYRHGTYKASVVEFAAQAEYTIWGGPYSDNSNPNAVYVFGGIGILNSLAHVNSNAQDLPATNIIAPFIPIGVGYQYALDDKFTIGAEIGAHCALGDRNNPNNPGDLVEGFDPHVSGNKYNDVIAFFGITFTYKFMEGR